MPSSYEHLRDQSLADLRNYMDSLPEKKGTILAYWIKDYARFLSKEEEFDPNKLIRYKRGSIVKAHLGYRIGSEEGGLHYAVVIDVANSKSAPTATIIPLTSVKPNTDLENLHPSRLYIGDEIYQALQQKTVSEIQDTNRLLTSLQQRVEKNRQAALDIQASMRLVEENKQTESDFSAEDAKAQLAERRAITEALSREIYSLVRKVEHCEKMGREIQKMKHGSIALVGQITTISKLRIYDPMYPSDTLSNIRLSASTMDKLDQKLRNLFTYEAKNCTNPGNNS